MSGLGSVLAYYKQRREERERRDDEFLDLRRREVEALERIAQNKPKQETDT